VQEDHELKFSERTDVGDRKWLVPAGSQTAGAKPYGIGIDLGSLERRRREWTYGRAEGNGTSRKIMN